MALNKNTGDEPGITGDELLGNWQVVDVEVLGEQGQGGDNEGPQVGMILQFEGQGMANVTFEGQEVTTFEYELLDPSNIFVVFDNEGDGTSSNEEPEANIFHVTVHNGSLLEMTLYAPGDDGDSSSGQQGTPGGAEYHLVFQRL